MTFQTLSSFLHVNSSEYSPQKEVLNSCFLKSFAKADHARHAFGYQNSSSKPSPLLSISEKPPRFFTEKLFASTNTIQCSYEEIAKIQDRTKRGVIKQIKKDIANGFIYKELTTYKCKKYKPLLCGKNIYRLIGKGRAALGRPSVDGGPTEKEKQAAKREKELSIAVKAFFAFKEEESAFEQLKKVCPKWWLSNPVLFKTTLDLLRQKMGKGYRIRSLPRWISHTIQDGGIGFRRRIARKWYKAIYSKKNPFTSSSPYVQAVFEHLCSLALSGKLDVSEKALLKLFRKGIDHLGIALRVYDKARKVRQIRNPNAFLNWLISFKEPFDFFNKRDVPILFQHSLKEMDPLSVIKWTEKQLLSIKDRCVFIKTGEISSPTNSTSIFPPIELTLFSPICRSIFTAQMVGEKIGLRSKQRIFERGFWKFFSKIATNMDSLLLLLLPPKMSNQILL